jgi:hypothetical protein
MPTYLEWNHALIVHFTRNAPPHAPVRLSVDDDVLTEVFATHFHRTVTSPSEATDDFREAIRQWCVSGGAVRLPPDRLTAAGEPEGVAFLAAMVHAAFRMIDDEDVAGHNYFTRLREVLGLEKQGGGRPDGMKIYPFDAPAPEAPLWQAWNDWLAQHGWIPTAALRPAQRRLWPDYPISQTLLRDGDRQRLSSLLIEDHEHGNLPAVPDIDRIAVFLRRSVARLPKHLQPIIRRESQLDVGRFEELTQEVLDLFLGLGTDETRSGPAFRQTDKITAGLYRHEDTVAGVLEYRLFPRQPRRYQGEAVTVLWNGAPQQLQPYQQRWFRWLGPVPPHQPPPVEIVDHPRLRQVVLPVSTFWVFVRETSGAGPWATWRRPELGERFLLFCRPFHAPHLEALRRAELLAWDALQTVTVFGEAWQEYRGCRILASNWNEVTADSESAELFAALRPPSRASIHVAGGLPSPDGTGWMHGTPPHAWVCAFQDEVELRLCSLLDPDSEQRWTVAANNPDELSPLPADLPPGPYLLSAHAGRQTLAERIVEIRSWQSLTAQEPEESYSVTLPENRLCGAALEPLVPDRR